MSKEAQDRFIAAADRLVNYLLTTPQPGAAALKAHEAIIADAMDEYDAARLALTGEGESLQ